MNNLIDESEEQSSQAEYDAEVYYTFHRAKSGLATPEEWDFLASALGFDSYVDVLPVEISNSLQF